MTNSYLKQKSKSWLFPWTWKLNPTTVSCLYSHHQHSIRFPQLYLIKMSIRLSGFWNNFKHDPAHLTSSINLEKKTYLNLHFTKDENRKSFFLLHFGLSSWKKKKPHKLCLLFFWKILTTSKMVIKFSFSGFSQTHFPSIISVFFTHFTN